jgi:hypothetical protein
VAGPGRPKKIVQGLLPDFRAALAVAIVQATQITFPSARYREDPTAFCREILGMEPWSKQVEIMEAVRDHKRVAVASGHKIGKSTTAAILAWWFYCSFEDARVVFTSTTSRQVDEILWRETCKVHARAGRCVACKAEIDRMRKQGVPDPEQRIPRPCPHSAIIPENPAELAKTGVKSADFRQIVGFTAKQAEAVAGISGANLLYLPDEASGIPQVIFDAMEGNRAGGARLAMFSNPTQNEGEFFDAFDKKKALYKTIRVSSEETPNAVTGIDNLIPGLANRSWIEEKKREWGEDSAQYKIRVKGEHALNEERRIFTVGAIMAAGQRYEHTQAEGRLWVGIDPAGASGTGDESAFAFRRGRKIFAIRGLMGLSAAAHLVHLLVFLREYRQVDEIPVVVIDREGAVGAELHGLLRAFLEEPRNQREFVLVSVRASDRAHRDPVVYDRQRDCLAACFEGWIKEGGAIPEDSKLETDMHQFEWKISAFNGRMKLHPEKEVLRKKDRLGRSPDRFDACCLATWEPMSLKDEAGVSSGSSQEPVDDLAPAGGPMDPYAASDAWRR